MINRCLNAKAFQNLQPVLYYLILNRGLSCFIVTISQSFIILIGWEIRRKKWWRSKSYFAAFIFETLQQMICVGTWPYNDYSNCKTNHKLMLIVTVKVKPTIVHLILIKTAMKPWKSLLNICYHNKKCRLLCMQSLFFPSLLELMTKKKTSILSSKWYGNYLDRKLQLFCLGRRRARLMFSYSSLGGGKSLPWKLWGCACWIPVTFLTCHTWSCGAVYKLWEERAFCLCRVEKKKNNNIER